MPEASTLPPPAAKPLDALKALAAPAMPSPPAMLRASWKDIHRSPLNPRKHFEIVPLQELADSIQAQGLLQNLVVRPHATKTGEYELIAGERRHRAYELLIKAGKAKREDQLPVQVRKLDDREASLIALLENVERNDLTPMEEAEAFAGLKKNGMLPKDIGRAIGKTERFVQKRIRLVADLDDVAVVALKDGTISVEQANVLAMVPKEKHQELVNEIANGNVGDTEQLKDLATEQLVPVGKQGFPLEAYKGEFVIDDEVSGRSPQRWFKDTAQVQKLIKAAIGEKRAKLEGKHAFVEVKKSEHGTSRPWDWDKADKPTTTTGALIVWCPGTAEIEVHAPVRKPAPRTQTSSSPVKVNPYGHDFINFYDGLATDALLAAIAGNPALSLRVAAWQAIDDEYYGEPAPDAVLDRWKTLTGKIVSRDKLAQWKALSKVDTKTLTEIVTTSTLMRLTENNLVDNRSGDKPPGVDPIVAAIAAEAKADVTKLWTFYGKQADAFLEACGPKQLERVAQDLGIEFAKGADVKAMRATIAKNVAANRKYMPPWLVLETSDEIAKRLKAPPAKAAAAPKKKG